MKYPKTVEECLAACLVKVHATEKQRTDGTWLYDNDVVPTDEFMVDLLQRVKALEDQ